MEAHETEDSVSQSYLYLDIFIKYIKFLKTDDRIKVTGEHDPVSPGKVLPFTEHIVLMDRGCKLKLQQMSHGFS